MNKAISEPPKPVNGMEPKGPKATQSNPARASIEDKNLMPGRNHQIEDLKFDLASLEIVVCCGFSAFFLSLHSCISAIAACVMLVSATITAVINARLFISVIKRVL